jgi:hypothetical protein
MLSSRAARPELTGRTPKLVPLVDINARDLRDAGPTEPLPGSRLRRARCR